MPTPTIHEAVAAKIGGSNPEVQNRVIDAIADKEIARRVDAILRGIDQVDQMTSELRKMKPDVVSYNDDGTVLSSGYSKAKLDERKKLTEKRDKMQGIVDKALDRADYGDLYSKLNEK